MSDAKYKIKWWLYQGCTDDDIETRDEHIHCVDVHRIDAGCPTEQYLDEWAAEFAQDMAPDDN